MSPKQIAEKILNCKTYDIPDIQTLARAYLELENNHIAAIALINKNISTLRMWTNPNSYLGSELLDLSNVNSKFLADNFTFQNSYLDLKSEITKLKEENKDLKYLLDSINKHVIPGELDSSEAATEIIKKQREEIKELKGLFSVQIDIHDRIVALEKKLDIAVNRFKEINNEELSNQRPGGGYSKSAIISFKAIKEIEKTTVV